MAKVIIARPHIREFEQDANKFWRHWLLWANTEASLIYLREHTIRWIKGNLSQNDSRLVDLLPDYEFACIGKYLSALNHGASLIEKFEAGVPRLVNELIEKGKVAKVESENEDTSAVTIKKADPERVAKRLAEEMGGIVDKVIDKMLSNPDKIKVDYDFVSLLSSYAPKEKHCLMLAEFYKDDYEEATQAASGGLNGEGYDHMTTKQWKKFAQFLEKFYADLRFLSHGNSKSRENPAAAVKNLNYKRSDVENGAKSFDPKHIIGAKEVWMLDVKTSKLGVYYADDANGLDIKGQTVLNFSNKSRHRKVDLETFKKEGLGKAGVKALRDFFTLQETLDARLLGKMNKNIVLVAYS